MALPTPDSLIAVVKPVPDTVESFIAKLTAKMADADVVKAAYRGGGRFSFYVEGYMSGTVIDTVKKQLVEAGYQVHLVEQQCGYVPPAHWIDIASAGFYDEGVTGTSQTPWFIVSVSKKKD